MFKSTMLILALALGYQGHAAPDLRPLFNAAVMNSIAGNLHPEGLINWKQGDSADYQLSGGIFNGTMHMFVRDIPPEGFWVEQDIDLGAMGQEKIEVLYDKDSGKVLKLIANGKDQTPPDPANVTIVKSKKDHIKVIKGEFDVIYLQLHDKAKNNDSEAWLNPTAVPVAGMVKTIAPSPFGSITLELTDFKRN